MDDDLLEIDDIFLRELFFLDLFEDSFERVSLSFFTSSLYFGVPCDDSEDVIDVTGLPMAGAIVVEGISFKVSLKTFFRLVSFVPVFDFNGVFLVPLDV